VAPGKFAVFGQTDKGASSLPIDTRLKRPPRRSTRRSCGRCCTIVGQAIRPSMRWTACRRAPARPGFLIVGLDTFRQIQMRHESAHRACRCPCRNATRGDDHDTVLIDEAILIAGAKRRPSRAGVIGQRLHARALGQCGGRLSSTLARDRQ